VLIPVDISYEATAMIKSRNALTPGTVFGIPRKNGGYYCVIYIASNQFGEAFGLFSGSVQESYLPSSWVPLPILRPVYSGKHLITTGRWVALGKREDLLKLFPEAPEIFHAKSDNVSNPKIGTYGSAETPDGKLRQLSQTEADEVGLTNGSYRHVRLEEAFEQFLNSTLE
jgi:hypothetical protein